MKEEEIVYGIRVKVNGGFHKGRTGTVIDTGLKPSKFVVKFDNGEIGQEIPPFYLEKL